MLNAVKFAIYNSVRARAVDFLYDCQKGEKSGNRMTWNLRDFHKIMYYLIGAQGYDILAVLTIQIESSRIPWSQLETKHRLVVHCILMNEMGFYLVLKNRIKFISHLSTSKALMKVAIPYFRWLRRFGCWVWNSSAVLA